MELSSALLYDHITEYLPSGPAVARVDKDDGLSVVTASGASPRQQLPIRGVTDLAVVAGDPNPSRLLVAASYNNGVIVMLIDNPGEITKGAVSTFQCKPTGCVVGATAHMEWIDAFYHHSQGTNIIVQWRMDSQYHIEQFQVSESGRVKSERVWGFKYARSLKEIVHIGSFHRFAYVSEFNRATVCDLVTHDTCHFQTTINPDENLHNVSLHELSLKEASLLNLENETERRKRIFVVLLYVVNSDGEKVSVRAKIANIRTWEWADVEESDKRLVVAAYSSNSLGLCLSEGKEEYVDLLYTNHDGAVMKSRAEIQISSQNTISGVWSIRNVLM